MSVRNLSKTEIELRTHDKIEQIQYCLQCKRVECTNCIAYGWNPPIEEVETEEDVEEPIVEQETVVEPEPTVEPVIETEPLKSAHEQYCDLYFLQNLTIHDVAKLCGVREDTVRKHVKREKEKMGAK